MTDERWRVTLVGDGVRLLGGVDSRADLNRLARAVDPLGWMVVASPVADVGQLPDADVARLAAADRATWPRGHPCRDCGRMADDHPPVDGCQAWR